ncbi:hypothetical protein [Kribbella sancticallisti]|uniref:2'-5' RNA ligase family protein n=1 Tax=Kribbella sancticallisti TaxID=460087 RepID=UPI0031E493F9
MPITTKETIIQPTKFDQLFESAVPLISSGDHQRDAPPVEGGRWPVSVVLRPPAGGDLSRRLDEVTREAAALAGPGHWQTGQIGSAHLTVRALETYRSVVDPSEPVIRRYQSALKRAAVLAGPARVQVTGLTLTPGTVMASAVPLDAQADLLLDQFATELGPDGWYEQAERRDIWYVNLLHFTTDIPAPEDLIAWVKAYRSVSLGEVTIDTVELVRFHHDPGERPYMRPDVLASVPLTASSGSR